MTGNAAWTRTREDGCEVSTDPARIDFAATHAAVAESFWCRGIPEETFRRVLANSVGFGLYLPGGRTGRILPGDERRGGLRLPD